MSYIFDDAYVSGPGLRILFLLFLAACKPITFTPYGVSDCESSTSVLESTDVPEGWEASISEVLSQKSTSSTGIIQYEGHEYDVNLKFEYLLHEDGVYGHTLQSTCYSLIVVAGWLSIDSDLISVNNLLLDGIVGVRDITSDDRTVVYTLDIQGVSPDEVEGYISTLIDQDTVLTVKLSSDAEGPGLVLDGWEVVLSWFEQGERNSISFDTRF